QATSQYPVAPEQVGLSVVPQYKQRFGCAVGLSDHSATIYPSLAAYVLGARFFEVHVTLSPLMFGPDVSSSLDMADLKRLADGLHFLERSLSHPVDKDAMAEDLSTMRHLFQKSLVLRADVPAGVPLELDHLDARKPLQGIPANSYQKVL